MSGDGGFGRDSGTPKRRMLPAVTDVVRELARTVSADPAVLFKAARAAVADELAKVKQGFESAPLDVLVRRARRQLEQEGVATPVTDAEEPGEPRSVSIAAPPLKPRKAASPSAEDPFQSAGAADLDWEKDLHIQPDDAPFRSAILPLPGRSRAPQGIAPPERPAASPPPAATPPPSPSRLPVPDRVLAPEGLATERSGTAARPKPPADDLPLFSSPTLELSSPLAPAPPPSPAPVPRAPRAAAPSVPERPAFAEVPAYPPPEPPAPLEASAPTFELPDTAFEPAAPPPEPEVRVFEEAAAAFEPPAQTFEPPAPPLESPAEELEPPSPGYGPSSRRLESRVRSMSEMPPLSHLVGDVTEPVEPAMEEFAFKAAEKASPPKKSGKGGWLAAVAVVLVFAAGLFWAVRTFLGGDVVRKVEAPAPAPRRREPAAPPPAAAPVPVQVEAPAPANGAPAKAAPAAKASAPVPKGRAALLLTPDWAGKAPVFVVHFSSSKDRPSAEREAKKLAQELGKPARAVEVDLGDKGIWYRAVVGEFASVDEARAYRADLEAKKTPGLGFVYEMRGR